MTLPLEYGCIFIQIIQQIFQVVYHRFGSGNRQFILPGKTLRKDTPAMRKHQAQGRLMLCKAKSHGFYCGHRKDRQVVGKSKPFGKTQADSKSSEGTGTDTNRHSINHFHFLAGFINGRFHKGRYNFCMSPWHFFLPERQTVLPLDHGCTTDRG